MTSARLFGGDTSFIRDIRYRQDTILVLEDFLWSVQLKSCSIEYVIIIVGIIQVFTLCMNIAAVPQSTSPLQPTRFFISSTQVSHPSVILPLRPLGVPG